jgi:isocitrate dehydrogenase
VFIDSKDRNPEVLGKKLESLNGDGLTLLTLSNRGVKVYPEGFKETFCTDHWGARFEASGKPGDPVSHKQVINLLTRLDEAGIDFVKTEHLYTFDGAKGFVAGAGE